MAHVLVLLSNNKIGSHNINIAVNREFNAAKYCDSLLRSHSERSHAVLPVEGYKYGDVCQPRSQALSAQLLCPTVSFTVFFAQPL